MPRFEELFDLPREVVVPINLVIDFSIPILDWRREVQSIRPSASINKRNALMSHKYLRGIPCEIIQPLHQHSPNLTKVGQ